MNWISVRPLFATTKIYKLKLWSIDFVLAFPQADLDVNLYTELRIGIYSPDGVKRDYILKPNEYIYGLNKSSANWFENFKADLDSIDFEQYNVDPWVNLRKYEIVLVYVDDCIIVSKYYQVIEDLVVTLNIGPDNLILNG